MSTKAQSYEDWSCELDAMQRQLDKHEQTLTELEDGLKEDRGQSAQLSQAHSFLEAAIEQIADASSNLYSVSNILGNL